ncbi:pimeloyl-CoA dehydrogenase small subunit [Tsukamurella pulmonis]|uniref:Acyl-CoA dehydrogenase n=1 Tax=Tsukamurella pulmonis TaxID=47312 RepID=A0A1H1E8H4_9ACTN|nr:acyl-CoA dehydrogenase [Tsukamurella pulmonis]KXO92045.1 pimeloyl-CoA dehydrogenase small subunit [Tsukamurella pulmonis]SDQ84850.1 Acyl-CoA dehydrogenase [Tsukamurella pulmonis]SUP21202.1 Acyl-CoA dehydrogenase fadE12 [Tsukamurella pulmonis]
MDFTLTDEQSMLRDAVRSYLAGRYPLVESRSAARSAERWQPAVWEAFASELGILAALVPESLGGLGGGPEEMMVITEELGGALVVEPYVGTAVVGAALLRGGGGESADAVRSAIAEGGARIAFALTEPESGREPWDIGATAVRDGDEYVLTGAKIVVADLPLATHLIVAARTAGDRLDRDGVSLFLLEFDPQAPPSGVSATYFRTIDDHHTGDLVLDEVRVPATALLGAEGGAWGIIERALDDGAAAVCSEAVGIMRRVVRETVEYAKQRRQFGVPIGSFQALQHRMVDMSLELEQSVAATYLAVLNLEAEPQARRRAVSAAKITVARAARFVGQNAVQLHGGMGMTEELAIGHCFKRLTAIETEFGSATDHLRRYADAGSG